MLIGLTVCEPSATCSLASSPGVDVGNPHGSFGVSAGGMPMSTAVSMISSGPFSIELVRSM